jgi:hypothetical protein
MTLNTVDVSATVAEYATGAAGQTTAAGVLLTLALTLALRRRRGPADALAPPTATHAGHEEEAPRGSLRSATVGRRWLIGLAVAAAVAVAGLGGVRSFEAVSATFGSALVPLTADGMIIACTALRLAALTRGWRLPGSLVTTYGFIGGTVWLNIAAAHGWTDAVAHALAPVSYAVLVEMLAHLLRLHLRLTQPTRPRVTALTWFTSPVVTTRVWLHLTRTGGQDPVAARALVQQLIRMGSRLQAVCPSPPLRAWWPFGSARAARAAALQTIRDGVLTAHDLAALLPDDETRLAPGALLALVDGAALAHTGTTIARTAAPAPVHGSAHRPTHTSAPEPVHSTRTTDRTVSAPRHPAPTAPTLGPRGRDERTDAELVAELHQHAEHNGGPVSQREVMRLLGVGTPKAKRLAVLAGWAEPTSGPRDTSEPDNDTPEQAAEQVAGQLALVSPQASTTSTTPTTSKPPRGTTDDPHQPPAQDEASSPEPEPSPTRRQDPRR